MAAQLAISGREPLRVHWCAGSLTDSAVPQARLGVDWPRSPWYAFASSDGMQALYIDIAMMRTRPGKIRSRLLAAATSYCLIARNMAMDTPRDTGDFRLLDRQRGSLV